jgi:hypothetical protein
MNYRSGKKLMEFIPQILAKFLQPPYYQKFHQLRLLN